MVRVILADLPEASEQVEESLEPLLSPGALEKANIPKDLPDYFVEQLFFPYTDGTAYVRRVFELRPNANPRPRTDIPDGEWNAASQRERTAAVIMPLIHSHTRAAVHATP